MLGNPAVENTRKQTIVSAHKRDNIVPLSPTKATQEIREEI